MKIFGKNADLVAIVTISAPLVAVIYFLAQLNADLNVAQNNIKNLEDGTTIDNSVNDGLSKIRELELGFKKYGLPVGSLVPFIGDINNIPDGYLVADGTQITKTKYEDLYTHLANTGSQFKNTADIAFLPDLRGVFLRGTDLTRGFDEGRTLGTLQMSQMQGHAHVDAGHDHAYTLSGVDTVKGRKSAPTGGSNDTTTKVQKGKASLGNPVELNTGKVNYGSENRPINYSVLYLIKY